MMYYLNNKYHKNSPLVYCKNYILGKIEQAVRLLLSWDFGEKVYTVLHQITMQLLRKPLTQEIAQHLQEALGSFHSSPIPLPSQIRHKFGHQVCVRIAKVERFSCNKISGFVHYTTIFSSISPHWYV